VTVRRAEVAEAIARELRYRSLRRLPLLEFVPQASPHLDPPKHLGPVAEVFERAWQQEVRVVVTCPPQHGKTMLALHALVWGLARHPERRNAYVSYSWDAVLEKMRIARRIAESACLPVTEGTLSHWVTRAGGGLWATGIGGPLTGRAVDGVLVLDDYVKGRSDADSATHRTAVSDWWRSVAMTRLHPGASAIIICTRWHPDDLAGELIRAGWEVVALPAIKEDGTPLWPERRPMDFLRAQREAVGERDWWALYMCSPRPREGQLFGPPSFYAEPPRKGRVAIGVDFAYTSRAQSDYNAAVVLMASEGNGYVLEVVRERCSAPEWVQRLKGIQARYPHATMASIIGGSERGVVDLMASLGLKVRATIATQDKYLRAQRTAAAWNSGRLLVPQTAPWLSTFLRELEEFTGTGDEHDDMVDALVSAWEATSTGPVAVAVTGKTTWS
jgi:predicted phage terminase large subunit-like protein